MNELTGPDPPRPLAETLLDVVRTRHDLLRPSVTQAVENHAQAGCRSPRAIYGEDLAPIDDTLPMILAVWTSYLAGGLSAIAVVGRGWSSHVTTRGALEDEHRALPR